MGDVAACCVANTREGVGPLSGVCHECCGMAMECGCSAIAVSERRGLWLLP